QTRARLHLGVDGRPQAGRVRSQQDLPLPLRHRQGRVTMADEKKASKKASKPATRKAAKEPAKKAAKKTAAKKPKAAKAEAKPKAAEKKAPTPVAAPPVVRASARYVRIAPRKARLIADQVRGMHIEKARALLRFSPRGAAHDIQKLIDSAAANAENNHDLIGD